MNSSSEQVDALPATIQETERLGRSVFSRTVARRAKSGRVLPKVFTVAGSISVDRLSYASPEAMAEIGRERGLGRKHPRNFFGWAVLTAGRVREVGGYAEATPRAENPYHADIRFREDSALDETRRQMEVKWQAKELADRSTWLEAPPAAAMRSA